MKASIEVNQPRKKWKRYLFLIVLLGLGGRVGWTWWSQRQLEQRRAAVYKIERIKQSNLFFSVPVNSNGPKVIYSKENGTQITEVEMYPDWMERLFDQDWLESGWFNQMKAPKPRAVVITTDEDLRQAVELFDFSRMTGFYAREKFTGKSLATVMPPEHWHGFVFTGIAADEEGIKAIAGCRELEHLELNQSRLEAAWFKHLGQLTKLKTLMLRSSTIEDEAIKNLVSQGDRGNLERLGLDNTAITDQSAPYLGQLRSLTQLSLSNTKLTDESVESLVQLQRLLIIDLKGTKISYEGAKRLKAELPNCKAVMSDWNLGW